jgi:hypothetical protein
VGIISQDAALHGPVSGLGFKIHVRGHLLGQRRHIQPLGRIQGRRAFQPRQRQQLPDEFIQPLGLPLDACQVQLGFGASLALGEFKCQPQACQWRAQFV